MKNKIFRAIICFVLILSLVLGETAMAFATPEAEATKSTKVLKEIDVKQYTFQKGKTYTYTGSQIKPKLVKIVADVTYEDENGATEKTSKTISSFGKISYKSNTSIGTGYVVAKIEGKTVELPFTIVLGKVSSIKVAPVSHEVIGISWSKVAGASGYDIYRSNDGSNKFKRIKNITSGSTLSYKNSGLSIGQVYRYKVRAYRYVGNTKVYGDYSYIRKTRARPATPVITSVKKVNYNTLKISWKEVPGALAYKVYVSSSPNGKYKTIASIESGKKLTCTDRVATCGKTYYYQVRAYRRVGLKRYFSSASQYKTGKTTPNGTKFTGETMSWSTSVDLVWKTSKGAAGYEIYRSTNAKSGYKSVKVITSGKTTKWSNKNLSSTKTYYYKIRPFGKDGSKKVYGSYSKTYTKFIVPKNLESLVKKYEGTRYRFGGNTPKGWDCSGFVQWATYYLFGKKIGRTAGDQYRGGKAINKNDMSKWKPGDVLVYKRNGGGVSHVGLYIGGGKMMHALNSRYDTVIQGVTYYENWDRGNYLAGVRRY